MLLRQLKEHLRFAALNCKIISEGKENRGNSNDKLKFQGKGNKKDNMVKSPSPPEGYIPAMISTVGTDLITLPVKPSKGKAGGSNSGGGAPVPQEIVNIREVIQDFFVWKILNTTSFQEKFCILKSLAHSLDVMLEL